MKAVNVANVKKYCSQRIPKILDTYFDHNCVHYHAGEVFSFAVVFVVVVLETVVVL